MKEFAVYTLARIGLFVAALVVFVGIWLLAGLGTGPALLVPVLVAAVVSAVASYSMLRGPRERFAAKVQERAANASRRFEEARAKEDED
ncbi:MAG: DUF4229 domain-containing protein [Nocardioides sp.]